MVYCNLNVLIKTKDGIMKTEGNSKQGGLSQTTVLTMLKN